MVLRESLHWDFRKKQISGVLWGGYHGVSSTIGKWMKEGKAKKVYVCEINDTWKICFEKD